jgi:hypothetical protein
MGVVNGNGAVAAGGIKSYTIIFISDLHGMLDGYGLPPDRNAGLGKIASLVSGARIGDGLSDRQVIVCLGGDMVKAGAHRLLHTDTVVAVWNHICEQIRPDVVVCGNHEFDSDFAPLWPVLANVATGATRNVYWLRPPPGGGPCIRRRNDPLPPSSLHRIVPDGPCPRQPGDPLPPCTPHAASPTSPCPRHPNEPSQPCVQHRIGHANPKSGAILIVGLVHQEQDSIHRSPLEVRNHRQQVEDVLKAHCLSCPRGGDGVFIHIAHYSEGRADEIDPEGKILSQGFGVEWLTKEKGKPNRMPHIILKAHCHSLTDAAFGGRIDRVQRLESRATSGGPSVEWVPTFAVGEMGELIGVLDVDVDGSDIHYWWRPQPPGQAHAGGNLPSGLRPLIRPGRDTLLLDRDYPTLGHHDGNPHIVCRTLCLLLRSMLMRYREPSWHLALAPVTCASARVLVPEVVSDAVMADYLHAYRDAGGAVGAGADAQSLWSRKLDAYDLRILFGTGKIRTSGAMDLGAIVQAIRASLHRRAIRPVRLPEYGDVLGATPCQWARHDNRTYVLVPQDGDVLVYEATDPQGQLVLQKTDENADKWIQRISPRFVTTTQRALDLYFRGVLAGLSNADVTALYEPTMSDAGDRSIVGECLQYLQRGLLPAGPGGEFWRPGV